MTIEEYANRNKADDQYTDRTPYDELVDKEEPNLNSNNYREAGIHFIRIMTLALAWILEGDDTTLRTIAVAYALGLDHVLDGKSQRQLARENGYSSGTISLNVKKFRLMAGLPLDDKSQVARTSRNKVLN